MFEGPHQLRAIYNGTEISSQLYSTTAFVRKENGAFTVLFFNNLLLFQCQFACYYVRLINGEPGPPRRLGFDLYGTNLTLKRVLPTLINTAVVLQIQSAVETGRRNYLVWDLERDLELESVENEEAENVILLGAKGKFGYIVGSSNAVTSLDRGVVYNLFNVQVDKFQASKVPFRMNSTEEYFVVGQTLHLRYNLAQILYAQGLRNKEERLCRMEKICYQLHGGTTALHDFALNLPTLTKIL